MSYFIIYEITFIQIYVTNIERENHVKLIIFEAVYECVACIGTRVSERMSEWVCDANESSERKQRMHNK